MEEGKAAFPGEVLEAHSLSHPMSGTAGNPVSHATLGRLDLFMPSASETRWHLLTERKMRTPIATLRRSFSP